MAGLSDVVGCVTVLYYGVLYHKINDATECTESVDNGTVNNLWHTPVYSYCVLYVALVGHTFVLQYSTVRKMTAFARSAKLSRERWWRRGEELKDVPLCPL
jgi:hypothetical protein